MSALYDYGIASLSSKVRNNKVIDSRLRGNDIKGSGNDIRGSGNDLSEARLHEASIGRCGNTKEECTLFTIRLSGLAYSSVRNKDLVNSISKSFGQNFPVTNNRLFFTS
jgi:hypothetical protein